MENILKFDDFCLDDILIDEVPRETQQVDEVDAYSDDFDADEVRYLDEASFECEQSLGRDDMEPGVSVVPPSSTTAFDLPVWDTVDRVEEETAKENLSPVGTQEWTHSTASSASPEQSTGTGSPAAVNMPAAVSPREQLEFGFSETPCVAIASNGMTARRIQCRRNRHLSVVLPVSHLNIPASLSERKVELKTNKSKELYHQSTSERVENIQRLAVPVRGFASVHRDSRKSGLPEDVIAKELDRVVIPKQHAVNASAPRSRSSVAAQTDAREMHSSNTRIRTRNSNAFTRESVRGSADEVELNRAINRIGTDSHSMLQLYERVHSTFLADMIGTYVISAYSL